MMERDAVQLQPCVGSNSALQIRQLLAVLPCLVLPHLVKPHKLSVWNFCFLISNIVSCFCSQPATREGSVRSFLTEGLAGHVATLWRSSVSNIISSALKRWIRTGECTAFHFWLAYLTVKCEEKNCRGQGGRVRTRKTERERITIYSEFS